MLDTRFKQYPLPPFTQDFINHLAVTNKSKSTQVAYTYELCSFFLYLCKSMHGFPSSPADIELNLIGPSQCRSSALNLSVSSIR